MRATIRSLAESSQHTQTLEIGELAQERTSSPSCQVFTFSHYQVAEPAPARTKSLNEVIERWKGDDRRAEALVNARKRLASMKLPSDHGGLRTLRLRAGMSQADLAKILRTSQPHIARIEGGTSDPTLDTCRRLARALSVDLNSIDQALQMGNGAE